MEALKSIAGTIVLAVIFIACVWVYDQVEPIINPVDTLTIVTDSGVISKQIKRYSYKIQNSSITFNDSTGVQVTLRADQIFVKKGK